MATKLSDYTIDELMATLRATEASVGQSSVSAGIIRRELDRKLLAQGLESDQARARAQFEQTMGKPLPEVRR